jgi:hypothetical protein
VRSAANSAEFAIAIGIELLRPGARQSERFGRELFLAAIAGEHSGVQQCQIRVGGDRQDRFHRRHRPGVALEGVIREADNLLRRDDVVVVGIARTEFCSRSVDLLVRQGAIAVRIEQFVQLRAIRTAEERLSLHDERRTAHLRKRPAGFVGIDNAILVSVVHRSVELRRSQKCPRALHFVPSHLSVLVGIRIGQHRGEKLLGRLAKGLFVDRERQLDQQRPLRQQQQHALGRIAWIDVLRNGPASTEHQERECHESDHPIASMGSHKGYVGKASKP